MAEYFRRYGTPEETLIVWQRQLNISFEQLFGDEYLEYGALAWDAAGVEFTMVNAYDDMPTVTVSVSGSDPTEFAAASYSLVVKHVMETVRGASRYSKIQVYPKGTALPAPTSSKIMMHAICTGMVER